MPTDNYGQHYDVTSRGTNDSVSQISMTTPLPPEDLHACLPSPRATAGTTVSATAGTTATTTATGTVISSLAEIVWLTFIVQRWQLLLLQHQRLYLLQQWHGVQQLHQPQRPDAHEHQL